MEENFSPDKPQKKSQLLIVVVTILIVFGAGYYFFKMRNMDTSKSVSFDGDATIKMGNDTYVPQNFNIKKGAKVTFVNNSDGLRWPASDLHPSHLIYPEFDKKQPVAKGESWTFQFDKVGEWGYHDHLAPYITGTIKVAE
jgi:plastocyanin